MPVDALHPDYQKARQRWDLVRSVVGNDAMKWIRTVDRSNSDRSAQYKQDAILTNFTALTKNGLTGLVFRRKPRMSIPSALNYLLDDATGQDLSLLQLSQFIIGEVLETGRIGVLVDYPLVEERPTLLDDQISGNVARLKPYTAESIINWRTDTFGSKVLTVLVVLQENINEIDPEDGFTWQVKKQYRVLQLDENQVYHQSVYNENLQKVSEITPTDYNGKALNQIPFLFIGSENNDSLIDNIPLYDLAVLNIGHYRNSADYEESIFISGQPTIFMHGDISLEEFKNTYKQGIKFGSRAGYYLGLGGGATLLQANPNQLAAAAMDEKMKQAALIGARIIAPPGGRETAEAARIRYASQNSALYLISTNISLALTECLEWAKAFMTDNGSNVSFVLNDQFYDDAADPNLIAQQLMLMDRGIIGMNDIRDYARRTGVIDDERTNEQLDKDAAEEAAEVPPSNVKNQPTSTDKVGGVE